MTGAVNIETSNYNFETVKRPNSRKSALHAKYVNLVLDNPELLIVQHNNLTQSEFLNIRSQLKPIGAKLQIVRVGLLEHAIKVAKLVKNETITDLSPNSINSRNVSKRAKKAKDIKVVELLAGPTCTITFSKSQNLEPRALKATLSVLEKFQGRMMLLGGIIEGRTFDITQIEGVSNFPALESLRGQLLGLLGSPACQLAGVLGASGSHLSRVLEGRKVQLEGENGGTKIDGPST